MNIEFRKKGPSAGRDGLVAFDIRHSEFDMRCSFLNALRRHYKQAASIGKSPDLRYFEVVGFGVGWNVWRHRLAGVGFQPAPEFFEFLRILHTQIVLFIWI